jgi:parallel beta-helix repeat protein
MNKRFYVRVRRVLLNDSEGMKRKSFILFAVLLLVSGNTVLVAERSCQSIEAASFTHVAGFDVEFSASSALELNKTYGGTGSDFALALVETVDGGYALAGNTASFGVGGIDFWLVRTDVFGNMLWNRTYGGAGEDRPLALVETIDGGYALTGITYSYGAGSGDFWLVKTDANGGHLWNRTYGGAGEDRAYALVETIDGGYALAGSTASFGAGTYDFWLVRTDASGNHLWNRTYGGGSYDDPLAFVQTVDGGYALVGRTYSFGAGNFDFWLVKTDSSGNMLWNRTYGGAGEDRAYALVETIDGGYALTGITYSYGAGSGDAWLIRTDAFGNHLWNKTYGGAGEDWFYTLIQTADGGYALVGPTYSFGAGSSDIWLVKTDASGNHLWNRTYGGTREDYGSSIIQTSDEDYTLAGGTKSFGAGSDDFWLVRTLRDVTTITVPDDYSTIQEAINGASSGDTIFVRSGIYYEHVIVNKTVSLVGENVSATIVDGGGSGNVFTINENNVSITSFTIRNSGTILGNAGLRLDNVSLCSISGNSIRDNFAGIWLEESSENLILANNITANVDDGIVFNYSHNNTISGNHIALHEYFGIVINWSHNNTIRWNNVTQTFGPSHGDGINLWRSSHNSIFQNQVEENNRYGIRIEVESNNNTISGNSIRNCSTGIQIYDSSNYNCIYGNNVSQCSDGVDINQHSTQNFLFGNTITDNAICGTQIYNAEYNQIDGNSLMNNWGGIGIHGGSHDNYMNGNYVENCTNGIILHDSDYNRICRNNVVDCDIALHFERLTNFNTAEQNDIMDNDCGVQLEYSSGNIFHHNNFVENSVQIHVIGYAFDTWDNGYPDGGNYWSDYSGVDQFGGSFQNVTGSDGIGDTAYTIDASNVDHFPLMLPYNPPLIEGDLNVDGTVDIFDIVIVALEFGRPPPPIEDTRADVNKDGVVDIFDIAIVAIHFGETS